MSKKYKKKNIDVLDEEVVEDSEEVLSKKELYDLNKKKKDEEKKKNMKKKKGNKKKKNDEHQINLMGRIFAIIMLILMIGSVVASIASYIK